MFKKFKYVFKADYNLSKLFQNKTFEKLNHNPESKEVEIYNQFASITGLQLFSPDQRRSKWGNNPNISIYSDNS